ncbi:MAG: rane-bound lytic murein transglycosylase [Sphingomonadales bacterium]|jgi:membrane-bound lytic murein transglycosylase A|nr:rane-bound lytic murein transglycosylase [Sphingomonadales bacterium]
MSLRPFAFCLLLAAAGCGRVVPRPEAMPPAEPQQPLPEATPPMQQPPPQPPSPPPPVTAIGAGVSAGPMLPLSDTVVAERAWQAFRISCPALVARQDASGLTRGADWRPLCEESAGLSTPAQMLAFFRDGFELVQVGDGAAFATGYYEPEIRGSRTRQSGFDVPIYAMPPDLLEADPRSGTRGRGRIDEAGQYVLYYDRTEIEEGVLAGRGLEIGWAADPVDLFFLQIQGSGRLRLPDGSVMRIGYAGQNGRDYVAVGRLLRERGLIEPPFTMQRIAEWLRAHPEEGRALMRENKSYVFFRELTGPGPLGALDRPVTPRVTVAADPRFVPLGAPVVLLEMGDPLANGLWVAQDTGGAIRGANRFDTFWGAGEEAARIAGGMAARGRAYLLLPRGTLARVMAPATPAQP